MCERLQLETERQRIEAEQWDDRAAGYAASADDLIVTDQCPDLTSHLLASLELLGDVRGKKVLDCGCGTGVTATWLARAGAEVSAFDVSGEMVALTLKRAEANGVGDRVRAAKMPFEALDFPDGFFDLAFGNMVLHHVDADSAGKELARVIRSGGRALFAETSARNPMLMLARRFLTGRFGIAKYSSIGEKPLGNTELAALGSHFSGLKTHYLEFVCFSMFASNVLQWRESTRALQEMLKGTDRAVYRWLPLLRRYSYFVVVELTR